MSTERLPQRQGPLSPYRVLDLTDEKGLRCAKLFADLGADVIVIEPPGGHPARSLGPFVDDVPGRERSLYWFTYNTGKRGITLNIRTAEGREVFKRLVRTADFLVESLGPGVMESLGLGFEALRAVRPDLIMASISNFGESGPYAQYKSSDLIATAMGGLVFMTGVPGESPVRMWGSPCYNSASIQAAAGMMFAHYHRLLTGEGQRVEVSMQESMVLGLAGAPAAWYMQQDLRGRGGLKVTRGGRTVRRAFRCHDGWVVGLPLMGVDLERLIAWMASEGQAEDLADPKYKGRGAAEGSGAFSQEEIEHIEEVITRFFSSKTKMEIYEEAQRHQVAFSPICSTQEMMHNPQLAARGYFQEVWHPELGRTILYPGPPVRFKVTPGQVGRPPGIGEHNEDVLVGEIGLSRNELRALSGAGVI